MVFRISQAIYLGRLRAILRNYVLLSYPKLILPKKVLIKDVISFQIVEHLTSCTHPSAEKGSYLFLSIVSTWLGK